MKLKNYIIVAVVFLIPLIVSLFVIHDETYSLFTFMFILYLSGIISGLSIASFIYEREEEYFPWLPVIGTVTAIGLAIYTLTLMGF